MAFVNERLTPEQREEFFKKGINNPFVSTQYLKPFFWTADYNKKAYLINSGAYHDLPDENLFIFIYNSNIFLFKIQMCEINSTIKEWNFIEYKILRGSHEIDEEQLMLVFKEALKEYKYDGLPGQQLFEMKINF